MSKREAFKAMFDSKQWIESKAQEIPIEETTADAFELVLQCVYTEEFVWNEDYLYDVAFNVYTIAHRFRFERLIAIIEKLLIEMVTKSLITNKTHYVFPSNNFNDWVLQKMNNLSIKPSVMAIIDSIAKLYEFATLYHIFELKISCLEFVFDARNSHIIIGKKSFLCESLNTMFELLEMMNKSVSQSVITSALRALREVKPHSDLTRFQSLVHLSDCSVDDIKVLRNIKIFTDETLIEMLIRDNGLKSSQIIELNTEIEALIGDNQLKSEQIEVLKKENNHLSLQKTALYDNYLRLKQVFEPFIRGKTDLWVNDHNYLRNYPRTRLNNKPKPKIEFTL